MGPLRAQFFKAEGSDDVGCVEVAFHEGTVGVRDSRTTAPVRARVHQARVEVLHRGENPGLQSLREQLDLDGTI